MTVCIYDRVENTAEKGENAPSQILFSRAFFMVYKSQACVVKG